MIVQTTNTKSGSENCSGKLKNRFQIQALDAAQEAFQGGCMTEEWRDVVGYEEYFSVSSEGRVYSKRTNKLLSLSKTKSGYLIFTTRFGSRESRTITFRVHRLVAEAFIPNPDNKPQVNHINAVKDDNRKVNLEWVTPKENMEHARDMGLLSTRVGKYNPSSKLRKRDIHYIRENFKSGDRNFGARALGRMFGVDKVTIMDVINGKTWKHVKEFQQGMCR